MSDVFISYKAEDRRRVQPLVQALQADGYSVWWDEHIGTGDEWRQTIEKQLDSARCVVVIWSKRSVGPDGRFVRDEASRAQRRGVYIPVLIDPVEPPLGFGESQAASLKGWKGSRSDARYQAVLAAVQRIAGSGSQGAAPEPTASSAVSRRTMVLGGAATAAALAGGGAWMLFGRDAGGESGSIAVLPFANLSGDPTQAYFSDGIAEELRSALARLAGLEVVGRTSSEAVKNDDAETAARKLGVANILTGSVRQSPSTIRVSAQLIDGTSGIERWSQHYDRAPGDSIKIQTDIAENVARALSLAIGAEAREALRIGGTENPAAQNLLFQADELSYSGTQENLKRSIELIDAALALDPNYAQAYGLKAIVRIVLVNRFSRDSAELAAGRLEAARDAKKALAIAPGLPIAHGALAMIYASNLQVAPALAEHKRTVALAAGDPEAVRSYANFVSRMGDSRLAIRLADQAVALDPLNPFSHTSRAGVLFDARRYEEAIEGIEKLQRESPHLFKSPITYGGLLMMVGRTDDSARAFAQAPADDPFRLVGEAILAARTGNAAGARSRMDRMKELYGEAASYQYAEIHAQLGEIEPAFAALERGWQIKDGGMLSMKVDPWLDPLRRDPRFNAMLRRIGFPA